MTKFTDEQHKCLMKGCIKIIEVIENMRDHINKDESLDDELNAIARALMNFSAKMIGK